MFDMKTAPPDGTILVFGIRYHGSNSGRIYTFPALCIGGRWFFTGSGPTDAGWGAVQRWLDDGSRQVVWVKAVTETRQIWPAPSSPEPAAG